MIKQSQKLILTLSYVLKIIKKTNPNPVYGTDDNTFKWVARYTDLNEVEVKFSGKFEKLHDG